MDSFETGAIVIGAGVVGLACAKFLAEAGHDTLVLEAASAMATETSSRNSEVIHAGLYYPPGSLKAKHCVTGRRALYEYLADRGITHWKCGKIVVAVGEDELAPMEALSDRARDNDVEHISLISGDEARRIEPHLSPAITAALLSPETGIFDSHGYMLAMLGDLEDRGGALALSTPVRGGHIAPDGKITLETGGEAPARISAPIVVNAAGHRAVDLARALDGIDPAILPVMRYVKGSYFTVAGRAAFSRLIYPMHSATSLGLHLTVDLNGRAKLGPDAEWLAEDAAPPFDYQVDPKRADVFYETVRRYWPGLPDNALAPDYAGVRPKLVKPGDPSGDFRIDDASVHGVPGLVNLFGIESPGLTSSLSIARDVAARIGEFTGK